MELLAHSYSNFKLRAILEPFDHWGLEPNSHCYFTVICSEILLNVTTSYKEILLVDTQNSFFEN